MKNISFFGILPFLALFLAPLTNSHDGSTYTVNSTESQVQWKAYKVTGAHEGLITVKDGNLDIEDGVLTGGAFTIDMTSINCTDLSGEYKGKLEGHLHSPDFFATAEFPTATLQITKVSPKGTPGDYKITGDLNIKGITKEVKFYANIAENGAKVIATADLKVDRSDFNVRYGSGSFFENLGDKTVYDEFDLTIKLVATK